MSIETLISRELNRIDELPFSLASVMAEGVGDEPLELLIFKPTEKAGSEISAPKALAVTQSRLVFGEAPEGRSACSVQSPFSGVLLVEMATLLLYGHLKIEFVVNDVRDSVVMEYNAASHESYRRAAARILDGASRQRVSKRIPSDRSLDLASWPSTLRRAAEFAMLPGASPHGGAWWGSVRSGFAHELAPAGAVLARGNRLTVVTLEQSGPWNRVRNEMTTGIVVTYLPAGHIAAVQTHSTPRVIIIDLEMHAQHRGERFQLAVPDDRVESVRSVINQVLAETVGD